MSNILALKNGCMHECKNELMEWFVKSQTVSVNTIVSESSEWLLDVQLGAHLGGGVGAAGMQPLPPSKSKLKKKSFVDTVMSHFYVIYPSTEISHWNRLMTSKMEIWKIKALEYVDFFFSFFSSHFLCNLTSCRLGDFKVTLWCSYIYVVYAWFNNTISKIIYGLRVRLPPRPPQWNILGARLCSLYPTSSDRQYRNICWEVVTVINLFVNYRQCAPVHFQLRLLQRHLQYVLSLNTNITLFSKVSSGTVGGYSPICHRGARGRSQAIAYGISGVQCALGHYIFPASGLPCQYYSTNATLPYFINLLAALYNFTTLECR